MTKEKDELIKENRVPMNVTLTPEDKRFLKVYAAEHDTTVSAIISDYVEQIRSEEVKKKIGPHLKSSMEANQEMTRIKIVKV